MVSGAILLVSGVTPILGEKSCCGAEGARRIGREKRFLVMYVVHSVHGSVLCVPLHRCYEAECACSARLYLLPALLDCWKDSSWISELRQSEP